jgi:hypothetical protein
VDKPFEYNNDSMNMWLMLAWVIGSFVADLAFYDDSDNR